MAGKKLTTAKNYNATYIYGLYNYGDIIYKAINEGERIDVKSDKFENVRFLVKQRQTTSVLVDVMQSPNIILIRNEKPLPQAFSVFAAKDLKKDSKLKVFIDVSNTVGEKDGFYTSKNIDTLVAQLVSAMTYLIYYADPNRIISNQRLTQDGTQAFTDLFCYVLDYLRVPGYKEHKDQIRYLVAVYYQVGMLWKDVTDTIMTTAMKVADIDRRHANIADMFLTKPEEQLKDINAFVTFLASTFKLNDLTTEVFVDKWVYLYGTGTQFGVELVPAFLKIITDTFAGTYIVRQNTITKILGKQIVSVTQDIFEIGNSAKGKK